MRGNTEFIEVFRGKTLNNGGINAFSSDFPLGEGITRAVLRLNHTVVIGTGAGAVSEGELLITKGISLRSDKSENFYRNAPGRGLYNLNRVQNGTAGVKDAIAAASATYRVDYDLHLTDPLSLRPMDTVLDSSRYKTIEFIVNQGTIADLFTAPGTATVVTTADLYVERVQGLLPDGAKPIFYREIAGLPTINPASQTYNDFEKSRDMALQRIYIGTHNSATSGVAWSGTPAGNVLLTMEVETDQNYPMRKALVDVINRKNKKDYKMESAVTGFYAIDLMRDGSNKSALFTGELSRLKLNWENDTLSTSQVSIITESIRELRA